MSDPIPQPCITQEMVIIDSQPTWRVCCGNLCVEDRSGTLAHQALHAKAREHGVELPSSSPRRPPAPGPDPDGRYGEPGT